MSEYVTVSIPKDLYHEARARARARRVSADALITELLAEGLRPAAPAAGAPTAEQEAVMARERAAYEAMHVDLLAAYAGKYVAVHGGQLVDHDADETALLRRIVSRFPGEVVLLKRVVPLPEPELRIRSPRLERDAR